MWFNQLCGHTTTRSVTFETVRLLSDEAALIDVMVRQFEHLKFQAIVSCPVLCFQYLLFFLFFVFNSYYIQDSILVLMEQLLTETQYVEQHHKMQRLTTTLSFILNNYIFLEMTCLFGSISDNLGNKLIFCHLKPKH